MQYWLNLAFNENTILLLYQFRISPFSTILIIALCPWALYDDALANAESLFLYLDLKTVPLTLAITM